MRSRWIKPVALAVLLALTHSTAPAEVLYQTGFESPAFVPGPLAGQDGWFPGLSAQAATVSTESPRTGGQSVRIAGSLLEPIDGFFIGSYGRDLSYDPISRGTPLIGLTGNISLSGNVRPGTSLEIGFAAFLNGEPVTNIQIGVRAEGAKVVSFISNMDGVSASLPGYQLGEWANVSAIFDFEHRTVQAFFNGQLIGAVPFSNGLSNDLPALFMFMGCPVEPIPDVIGNVDDFSAPIIPEPSTLTLTAVGALGLFGYCCRRRTRAAKANACLDPSGGRRASLIGSRHSSTTR